MDNYRCMAPMAQPWKKLNCDLVGNPRLFLWRKRKAIILLGLFFYIPWEDGMRLEAAVEHSVF